MLHIDRLAPADWPAVAAIYAEGIAGRAATFETEVPGWEAWDAGHLPEPRLVARRGNGDGEIVGYAALSPVSKRAVYAGVAEATLYVAGTARREGVGRALLAELVARSEAAGIWTVQASILAANAPSRRLFAAGGFREVGRRERLGRLDGVWHDVILMERRSAVAGR